MKDLVEVRIGECRCPQAPHADGDIVYLRPKLGLARAMAVISGATSDVSDEDTIAFALAAGYPRWGIADWNLTNGTGEKQPVDAEHLQRFVDSDPRAMYVAMQADDLYSAEVTNPLVAAASISSLGTSTSESTSAVNGSKPSTKRRKRSKQSLTTTIPTDDTATTSS